jgi:glutamine synthetase
VFTQYLAGQIAVLKELAIFVAPTINSENQPELPPPLEGKAYESDAEVGHYLNHARTEERLFDEVVTRYERERMFERG